MSFQNNKIISISLFQLDNEIKMKKGWNEKKRSLFF